MTATKKRPSARAPSELQAQIAAADLKLAATRKAGVTARELAVLRAKAAVCDAYRVWLDTPARKERAAVNAALTELSRIEWRAFVDEPESRAPRGKP